MFRSEDGQGDARARSLKPLKSGACEASLHTVLTSCLIPLLANGSFTPERKLTDGSSGTAIRILEAQGSARSTLDDV